MPLVFRSAFAFAFNQSLENESGCVGGAAHVFSDVGFLYAVTHFITFVGIRNVVDNVVDVGMFRGPRRWSGLHLHR